MASLRGLQLGILGGDDDGGRSVEIDMIQTARGNGRCSFNCSHCGANYDSRRGKQIPLTRKQLLMNLTNPVDNYQRTTVEIEAYDRATTAFEARGEYERGLSLEVRTVRQGVQQKVIANYLAPFLTTDVDTEPTRSNSFNDTAELVYAITGGESRMFFISHGTVRHVRPVSGDKAGVVREVLRMCDLKNPERSSKDEAPEIYEFGKVSDVEISTRRESVLAELLSDEILDEALIAELKIAMADEKGERLGTRFRVIDRFLEHGLMEFCDEEGVDKEADDSFVKTVELARRGVIPLVVLTLDCARFNGKISPETNLWSYVKTMNQLKPLLAMIAGAKARGEDAEVRVVISVQGDDFVYSPFSKQRAHRIVKHIRSRCELTNGEWGVLEWDCDREMVKAGEAVRELPWLDEEGACDVVPYEPVNKKKFKRMDERGIVLRARLRDDGTVDSQGVEKGKTYNTTVLGPWRLFDDVEPVVDETRDEVESVCGGDSGAKIPTPHGFEAEDSGVEWSAVVTTPEGVFKILPFSHIREVDRPKFLGMLTAALGGKSIVDLKFPDGQGGERDILNSDLKITILKALLPEEEWKKFMSANGGNMFSAQLEAAMARIRNASGNAYQEAVEARVRTGHTPAAPLLAEAHYSGEVGALVQRLKELGFDSVE